MRIILALMTMSIFLLQNCFTIARGTSQKIPVTSYPSGAKIIVDREEIGHAPLNLKLKKKKSHIIRIEKQGYYPFEIIINRKSSLGLSILGNYLPGGITGPIIAWLFIMATNPDATKEEVENTCTWAIFLGWGAFVLLDVASGANYTLSPEELNVNLSKIEEISKTNLILIDAEQFKNIKWIRIKCVDSDMEDKIEIQD